jgi:hypothetical protein
MGMMYDGGFVFVFGFLCLLLPVVLTPSAFLFFLFFPFNLFFCGTESNGSFP